MLMATKRVMVATVTRVAGNEQGDGKGGKSNGNGDEEGNGEEEGNGKGGTSNGNGNKGGRQQRGQWHHDKGGGLINVGLKSNA